MNILVTGGCGFIGSNFVKYLFRQWEDTFIINLDDLTYAGSQDNLADLESIAGGTRYFFVRGDISDVSLVNSLFEGSYFGGGASARQLLPDIVVNFAAETHVDRSIEDSAPFLRTNVLGTQVLLEVARRYWTAGARGEDDDQKGPTRRLFLQISTDEVYGCLGEEGRFTEESPLSPNSPYAASKAAADLLARSYHQTYGLPVIITRSTNNYGPYQFPEKFIPLMIVRALAQRPLPVYGDGRNVRDWLYVEDHCEALACVLQKGTIGEVYNIGGGAERRNLEVAERILDQLGQPRSLINFVPDRLGHDWRYALEYKKTSELGWKPRHGFDEGLELTLQWYRANPRWYQGRLEPAL